VGNTDLMKQSLNTVYKSSQWNPTNEKLEMACMAAYFGNGRDGSSYNLAQAKTDIDALVTGVDGFKNMQTAQKAAGIPLFGVYEGGQSVLTNSSNWNVKQDAADAVTYLYNVMQPYFNIFCHYTDASACSNNSGSSCWGLKLMVGGSDSAKSTAVKNWVKAH
jgi:hypothetical protein